MPLPINDIATILKGDRFATASCLFFASSLSFPFFFTYSSVACFIYVLFSTAATQRKIQSISRKIQTYLANNLNAYLRGADGSNRYEPIYRYI